MTTDDVEMDHIDYEILKSMELQETDKDNAGITQQNQSISIDDKDICDAENVIGQTKNKFGDLCSGKY